METFDFLNSALGLSPNAIGYHVSERLAGLFADKAIIEGEAGYFDLEKHAEAGLSTIRPRGDVHSQFEVGWDEECGVYLRGRNAWFEAEWNGDTFDVLMLTWNAGFHDQKHIWIVGDDESSARSFYADVCAWNAEVRDEVLVFDGGCWSKSESLFASIQNATFENLVLAGSLKEEIRDDLSRFFAMKATYDSHGVPWKRGVLFVGPPGNGKTHAVKSLINAIGKPCLYVKSFQSEHATEHDCIRSVFHRARKSAPCILVLEDLDSLINAGNRSFFLNELDGFAANTGVVALATTNHPDRLDPAILDRPSRFDRKYHFDLPTFAERLSYIRLWSESLKDSLRPDEAGQDEVARGTEGFSFAYLKELFVSAMMRWIAEPGSSSMDAVLLEQVEALRGQMASAAPEEAASEAPADPILPPWMRMPRHHRR